MRLTAFAVVLVVACADGQATTSTVLTHAPATIDSIVAHDVAIARFLDGIPKPSGFRGGAAGTDELVARLFDAIANGDSAAVADMSLSRAEYGYFYYPTSVYARKPYELPPEIAWMLSSEASNKGSRRLISRLGGRPIEIKGFACSRVEVEGDNQIISECTVDYSTGSGPAETRELFRSIILRNGVAKFLSYAGDF